MLGNLSSGIPEKLIAKSPNAVKKVPDGFLLLEGTKEHKEIKLLGLIHRLLLGCFFSLIGFFSVVILWSLLPQLLIGIIVVATFFPKIRRQSLKRIRRFFLPRGELLFSNYPLHLGEEFNVTFRRPLNFKRIPQKTGSIFLKVFCFEQATYTYTKVGWNLEKHAKQEFCSYPVWESQQKCTRITHESKSFSLETSFVISKHLPPSFEGECNQIRWCIEVQQMIPGFTEEVSSAFTFTVLPRKK